MKKNKIHVIGPTYIDHTITLTDNISLDGSSKIKKERYDPGGTGLCYAIALSRLGNNTHLYSVIGKDKEANMIRRVVKTEKITANWQIENGNTDHAYIIIDRGNHKVVASKKELSDRWDKKLFLNKLHKNDAIVITSFKNKILSRVLGEIGKLKIKPFVMWAPHRQNCNEAEELDEYLNIVDHITLSSEEFDILKKKIGNPLKLGIKSMTVTNGKNGCILITEKGSTHYNAFRKVENPIDTNGSGEAFGSGFLTIFLKTKNYEKSIKAGSYLGYLHIHRPASDFPKISKENLISIVNNKSVKNSGRLY